MEAEKMKKTEGKIWKKNQRTKRWKG